MSNKIEESYQSPDLRKLEVEIQDWVVENASIIIEWYTVDKSSAGIEKELEEDPYAEFKKKTKEIKESIKNLINKETSEKIPLIFHHIIMIVIRLLRDPNFRNSIILNSITLIYLSVLFELKTLDPEKYSSLEPFDQFSPNTFYSIGNELSRDKDLVEIIDEEFWKDRIFEKITEKEENKLMKHSLRSLILYFRAIQNRKERLLNL